MNIKMFVCSRKECHLKGKLQDIQAFRPSGRERAAKAIKRLDEVVQKENLDMDALDKVRCKMCIRCREIKKKSQNNPNTKRGKCRFFYKKMREEAVCEICSSSENIEFDHIDAYTKIHGLGHYAWWAWHGGVPAMEEEFKKCRPLCKRCHDKHTQATRKRKYEHTDDMPTNTRNEKMRKKNRKYKDEKAAYVLGIKMQIGACQHCRLPVNPDNRRSFHFAHKNAAEKVYHVSKLQEK